MLCNDPRRSARSGTAPGTAQLSQACDAPARVLSQIIPELLKLLAGKKTPIIGGARLWKRRNRQIRCTLNCKCARPGNALSRRSIPMFEFHTTVPRPSHPRAPRLLIALPALAILLFPVPRAQAQDRQMEELRKLNSSVDALLRKVSPSVVQILVTGYGPLEASEKGNTSVVIGRQRAIGSGFVIDPVGYIITNAHVVSGAQVVQVVLPSGNPDGSLQSLLSTKTNIVPARVVGVSREIDLALLKVDNVKLEALPVAPYRSLRQGEVVLAFGSPEGLRNTVTLGVISSVARQTDPDSPMVYIQTDAPINPGNSGGPLVNVDGAVVGVNTFILSQSGGNEGLGFAIPSSVVNVAYQQLRKFGHVHRAQIGIGLQTITPVLAAAMNLPRSYGVIVSDVLPGGPALEAGIRIGDVLLTIDGRMAESIPYVSFRLMSVNAGEKVHLEVLRGQERLAFDVTVIEHTDNMDQITALADPEKSLVRPLGILGIEIDKKVAEMASDLRDPFGIVVAAR